MGVAVAAAGSLLGGLAAHAAGADKGLTAPDGGGIPGLTSSKGEGKHGNGRGYAIQVDPTTALNYFKDASKEYAAGYDKGLSYYLPTLQTAANQIIQGYQAGNDTLRPMSDMAVKALNQQMRMMGLDPMPMTATYGDALGVGYDTVKKLLPKEQDFVSSLQSKISLANKERDPDARAAILTDFQNSIDTNNTTQKAYYQKQIDDLTGKLQTINPNDKKYDADYLREAKVYDSKGLAYKSREEMLGAGTSASGMSPELLDSFLQDYQSGGINKSQGFTGPSDSPYYSPGNSPSFWFDKQLVDRANAKLQPQIEQAKQDQKTYDAYATDLNSFKQKFTDNYTPEYDKGYTGDEVEKQVTSLPGYEFQTGQGVQAIQRGAAAKGMLGSANTGLALQDFGQQLGMNYYNQYMGYLGNMVNQGAGSLGAISQNQVAEGGALAGLSQLGGQAMMQNEQQKASFLANQLMASGQLFNATAMFNASAQNASIQNSNNNAQSGMNAAIGAVPGIMQAQNGAGQLNLALQNAQGANNGALLAAGGGGGQGSFGSVSYNGMSFPKYSSTGYSNPGNPLYF